MAVCRVINGTATSLGRVPIVLDIFAERDLYRTFTIRNQGFVDDFVMKASLQLNLLVQKL